MKSDETKAFADTDRLIVRNPAKLLEVFFWINFRAAAVRPIESWPLHRERIDFLCAEIAGKDGRAVGSGAQFSVSDEHCTSNTLEASYDFGFAIRQPYPRHLWFRSSGGVIRR